MPKRKHSEVAKPPSVSQQIRLAISAAQVQFGAAAWQTADRLIAERDVPAVWLAADLAGRIVGFGSLLPDLWRLVAGYAVVCNDEPADGLRKLVFQRVVCLHFVGCNRTDDALRLSESSIRTVRFGELPYWFALNFQLFSTQRYEACERLCTRFLTLNPDRTARHQRPDGPFPKVYHHCEWSLFRSLSLSFLGRFDEAAKQIRDFPYEPCWPVYRLFGWKDLADFISMSDRWNDRYKAWILHLMRHPSLKSSRSSAFLLVLVEAIQTNAPAVLTADWLRTKHAETVAYFGAKFVSQMTAAN
jgi:hypothetical protein